VLHRRFIALLWLALAPALSAAVAPVERSAFVGIWYGVGEPDDPDVFYIDDYHADGTFNSEFRKCVKGKLVYRQTTSGTWKVVTGVLMMVSDISNGAPIHFEHNYDVISLTRTEFQAQYHNPEFLFVENRIPEFKFPPCYVGS
jgi:hypothetical protein